MYACLPHYCLLLANALLFFWWRMWRSFLIRSHLHYWLLLPERAFKTILQTSELLTQENIFTAQREGQSGWQTGSSAGYLWLATVSGKRTCQWQRLKHRGRQLFLPARTGTHKRSVLKWKDHGIYRQREGGGGSQQCVRSGLAAR